LRRKRQGALVEVEALRTVRGAPPRVVARAVAARRGRNARKQDGHRRSSLLRPTGRTWFRASAAAALMTSGSTSWVGPGRTSRSSW